MIFFIVYFRIPASGNSTGLFFFFFYPHSLTLIIKDIALSTFYELWWQFLYINSFWY
ncbi:uncharacterized protein BX663DRAFT_501509, partial [Cokeromyces recurvatus]|uniref:uncharacterized protein n=1 Tax=Cokeromyces recurvatus TaxID=90255 RepID=UPI00221ECC07